MNSRYLFRDGVLIDKGDHLRTFDECSLKGDYMLTRPSSLTSSESAWWSYQMVFFDPDYGWQSQPPSVTEELRTLLLLQET